MKAWTISITFMFLCFFLVWFLTEIADTLNEKAEEEEAEGIKNSPTMIFATVISQSIAWTIIFFNKFVIGKVIY